MIPMDIYLDIDGVLIDKRKHPALYLKKFLKFVTENYSVYWLTTHCKGNADQTIEFLSNFLNEQEMNYARKIKPTSWNTAKTEAINFNNQFLWLDDCVFDFEKRQLSINGCESRLIEIDLRRNSSQLNEIVNILKKHC